MGQFVPNQKRHLCAASDDETALLVEPPHCAVSFQGHVLDSRSFPRTFDDCSRICERTVQIADAIVKRGNHVAGGLGDPRALVLVAVQEWSAGGTRQIWFEYRVAYLVVDFDQRECTFRLRRGFGDDRGYALAAETEGAVEHARVVRIVVAVLVPGGREQHVRTVMKSEDRGDARRRFGCCRVYPRYVCVCVRTAEYCDVKQVDRLLTRGEVHGVLLGSRDDARGRRCCDRTPLCPAYFGSLRIGCTGESVTNGPITGAAAQVTFHRAREIGFLLDRQR